MTKEEMSNILNILYVAYPNSFKGWTKDQYQVAANLWFDCFKQVPYKIVTAAVKKEISTNRTSFAPSIGEIMYHVRNLVSVYDAESQFEEICYIVRTVDFEGIVDAVKRLDPITRTIINSRDIQRLKSAAGSLERERPRFTAAYNKIKDQKEEDAVRSGNMLSISNPERLASLGVTEASAQIEQKA